MKVTNITYSSIKIYEAKVKNINVIHNFVEKKNKRKPSSNLEIRNKLYMLKENLNCHGFQPVPCREGVVSLVEVAFCDMDETSTRICEPVRGIERKHESPR